MASLEAASALVIQAFQETIATSKMQDRICFLLSHILAMRIPLRYLFSTFVHIVI